MTAAAASALALIMQVLQAPGEKEYFTAPGSTCPEGQKAQQGTKLIGHTYLVCLGLSLLPLRENIFPLSLICRIRNRGWRTRLECSQHLKTICSQIICGSES